MVVIDSTSPVMIIGVPVILYSIRNSLAPSVVQWRLSTYKVHCCEIRHLLTDCQESTLNRKKAKPFHRNTDIFCSYYRTQSGLISLLSRKQQQHFYGWLPNISCNYINISVHEPVKIWNWLIPLANFSPPFSKRSKECFKTGESR